MVLIRKRKVFTTTTKITVRGRSRVVYSRPFRRTGPSTEDSSNKDDVPAEREDFLSSFTDTSVAESLSGPAVSSVESEKPPENSVKNNYSSIKERRLQDWSDLRGQLLDAFLESNAPTSKKCSECTKEDILYRCLDCTPWDIVCQDCLNRRHQYPHLHMFEAWRNEAFIGAVFETPPWTLGHKDCDNTYFKSIVIIDVKGRQHKRDLQFCTCEAEAVTLIRYKLWPSTVKHPKVAFDLELLKWLNGLLIECQVSCKGFCEALKFRCSKHHRNYVNFQISDIYKALMTDTLAEFRHFYFKTEFPESICDQLDNGSQCPACFSTEPKIYSFDADFQLVRKASAGRQWDEPKHQHKFFLDQTLVDRFVDQNVNKQKLDVECNDFQAGNELRSKNKNKKLSETAIFGSTCRHEFPKYFFSLKHGERLGYSVYLLKQLLEENKSDDNFPLYIMYDIACSLENHLKKQNEQSILQKVNFSIPIFHCYGHKMACQVLYSPRKTKGVGLTDGESLERLWSYLGKFSKITKEMTPENRIDLLTDGLIHYGKKIRERLGYSLVSKMEKAVSLESASNDELKNLLKTLPGISDQTVLEWIEDEKNMFTSPQNETKSTVTLTQQEQYSLELEHMYEIRKKIPSADLEQDIPYQKSKTAVQKRERKLKERWTENDHDNLYITTLAAAKDKMRNIVLIKMQANVAERHFLLELMKKYARGQSIAIRLSRQLKKTGSKINQMVKEYNQVGGPQTAMQKTITFDDIKDLSASIWQTSICPQNKESQNNSEIPFSIKQQAVTIKSMIERSVEEQRLVKKEMKSTIDWHLQQHYMLKNALNSMSGGRRACLVKEGLHVETNLSHLEKCFSPYISDDVLLPTFFYDLIETVHLDNESLLRDKTCNEDNWNCEDEFYSDDDGDDDDDDVEYFF